VVVPFPISSLQAAEVLRHYGIKADAIYVDGSHESNAVYMDLLTFHEVLGDGGLMWGDDYSENWPGVQQAVNLLPRKSGTHRQRGELGPAQAPALRADCLNAMTRRVRVCYFNTWAGRLEDAAAYVARVGKLDLRPLVSDRNDPALLRKARLDCDWYGENARCFAAMSCARESNSSPAWVCGAAGIADLGQQPRDPGEESLVARDGPAEPRSLGSAAGRKRLPYWRRWESDTSIMLSMRPAVSCRAFQIAPALDVLIHDEAPLAAAGAAQLRPGVRTLHRSWVTISCPARCHSTRHRGKNFCSSARNLVSRRTAGGRSSFCRQSLRTASSPPAITRSPWRPAMR